MESLITGTVVRVTDGKYKGQAGQVRKVNKKTIALMIAGRIVTLSRERVKCGQ